MNDARMTIRLPGDTLAFAQGYAAKCNISLTDLVVRYFERLRESLTLQDEDASPALCALTGAIKSDISDADERALYRKHLSEKHT